MASKSGARRPGAPRPAAAAAGAPTTAAPASGSPEEREKEMAELVEKLKKAAAAPEQAGRRVRDLDRIVATLRKHRADCAAAMEADTLRIAEIEKQEAALQSDLRKLETRLAEREETAEKIREQMQTATGHLASFVSAATQRVVVTRVTSQQQQRRHVSEQLQVERGYTTSAADKAHLKVPASFLSTSRSAGVSAAASRRPAKD